MQVNFVPVGTLRGIIIYPQDEKTWRASGGKDADLIEILKWAHLEDLKCDNQHPTLDDKLDWDTALSPVSAGLCVGSL